MICGAEDLIAVCKEMIAPKAHALSPDGKFSWEEVECMGACANAPMAQIGKDYYEDLTPENLRDLIARLARGDVPVPGPQNGRYASEPLGGLTSLRDFESGRTQYNASAQRAVDLQDTVRRIDGTEVPLVTPWQGVAVKAASAPAAAKAKRAGAASTAAPAPEGVRPATLAAPRGGKGDDLTAITGVGPKLAALLNGMGFHHLDQIASWTADELAWVDRNLDGFKGRATRDDWVGQAKRLMIKD
jgi:NADH-quinone oxidoreductase subunit E